MEYLTKALLFYLGYYLVTPQFYLVTAPGSVKHTICTFLGLLIKTKNNTSSYFMLPSVLYASSFLTH